jgi:hypothetical protein
MSTAKAKISPGDVDTWTFDWTDWLSRKSEEHGSPVTIVSATWTVSAGLSVLGAPGYPAPQIFDGGQQTRVWWDASALTVTDTAVLTCTIVTSAGHERCASVALSAVRR